MPQLLDGDRLIFCHEMLAFLELHADRIDRLDNIIVEVLREPLPLFERQAKLFFAPSQRLLRSLVFCDVTRDGQESIRSTTRIEEGRDEHVPPPGLARRRRAEPDKSADTPGASNFNSCTRPLLVFAFPEINPLAIQQ